MGRSALLMGLQAHNRERGLSPVIWGEGAAQAALQAAESVGAALPPVSTEPTPTALQLDTPLDLEYAVRCDAPERLHFPTVGGMAGLDRSPLSLEVALLRQGLVREWQGYHLLERADGIVVDGSSAYWPLAGGVLESHGVSPPGPPRRRERLAEAFVVCDDLDTTNFCHFICDLLPKIALAGECRRRIPIVMEPASQPFQRELLSVVTERHGHPIIVLEPGMELAVERLFYMRRTQFIHPLLRCSGMATAWLRQLVDARPMPARDGSVLYLRRQRRRVLNEGALIGALQAHTSRLEVVDRLEHLSVRDQAELVTSQGSLIGPHGAGFTHLLFANGAPRVALEFMAQGNGTLTFALISSRVGVDHRIHVATHTASMNGPNYPDMEVDVEAVMTLLTGT